MWNIRNNHLIQNLPTQYIFHLVCCYKPSCSHPYCKSGYYKDLPKWFSNGPNVSCLPVSILDPARPWGSTNCSECKGNCYGHFLSPEIAMLSPLPRMLKPPSVHIKEMFEKLKTSLSELQIQDIAKAVLLPPEEVNMWLKHLEIVKENRKQGAIKAAQTRMKNKKVKDHNNHPVNSKQSSSALDHNSHDDVYYCGVCNEQYIEYTDIEKRWIGCESCDSWFPFVCVGIDDNIPGKFFCEECANVNYTT